MKHRGSVPLKTRSRHLRTEGQEEAGSLACRTEPELSRLDDDHAVLQVVRKTEHPFWLSLHHISSLKLGEGVSETQTGMALMLTVVTAKAEEEQEGVSRHNYDAVKILLEASTSQNVLGENVRHQQSRLVGSLGRVRPSF